MDGGERTGLLFERRTMGEDKRRPSVRSAGDKAVVWWSRVDKERERIINREDKGRKNERKK